MNLIVELYRTDLETYAHQGLPRVYMAKSFHDRPDSTYLYLVRQCPYLHTLVSNIKEKINGCRTIKIKINHENGIN